MHAGGETYGPVVLIGAGQLATCLGLRMAEKKIPILQVYSRTFSKAKELAALTRSEPLNDLKAIHPDGVLYILAVSDQAIGAVAQQLVYLNAENRLFVHTSGGVSSSILTAFFNRSGIFYPLQSFSRGRTPDFDRIPIGIHARSETDIRLLETLGHTLSSQVFRMGDEQRAMAHIAAVFANNFSNHLWDIAQKILAEAGLPFDLIRPLIQETADKVQVRLPESVQTGPAARGDENTIARHLELLETQPDLQKIYQLLTQNIRK